MTVDGIYQIDGSERIEKEITDVECGKCIKTKYFNAAGELVRQDVNIEVTKGFTTKAFTRGL